MLLPSTDPAAVARDHAPQFEASEGFLDALWASLPHRGRGEFELVLMNVLGRSIGTYRALLHLLRGGFTDQAWMLTRPLFEDMVFGYWIALPENRASARTLVSEHMEKVNDRIGYLFDRVRAGGFDALAERDDPEKNWAGRDMLMKGLAKRVDQIKDLWVASGGTLGELYVHREVTHWMSNLAMHTSGRSLLDALGRGAVKTESGSLYAYGQSSLVDEDHMLNCFEFAAFRVGWLARLVLLESRRSVDAQEAAYNDLIRAVREWALHSGRRPGATSRAGAAPGRSSRSAMELAPRPQHRELTA